MPLDEQPKGISQHNKDRFFLGMSILLVPLLIAVIFLKRNDLKESLAVVPTWPFGMIMGVYLIGTVAWAKRGFLTERRRLRLLRWPLAGCGKRLFCNALVTGVR